MYIYDKVHEFARELKDTPEVVNYKKPLTRSTQMKNTKNGGRPKKNAI
ncbi:hypothetical protein [Caloramator sp. Dgby_cultured_2]|nr:hypothetical protein [Caloramator sp. Dgby_cultured_2]WDU84300.1 hypothetical protein PWK10_08410 [Caloramator sp. Dgby_cultured_2]